MSCVILSELGAKRPLIFHKLLSNKCDQLYDVNFAYFLLTLPLLIFIIISPNFNTLLPLIQLQIQYL